MRWVLRHTNKMMLGFAMISANALSLTDNNEAVYYPIVSMQPGFYIRAEAGYQLVNAQAVGTVNTAVFDAGNLAALITEAADKSQGFTGRAAFGYEFRHFGIESGFSLFNAMYRTYDGGVAGTTAATASLTVQKLKTNLYGIDLLFKALMPFKSFYTFIGAGGAYIHEQYDALTPTLNYTPSGSPTQTGPFTVWPGKNLGFIRPKFVVGAGYLFTSHFALDASYDYILGQGSIPDPGYLPDLSAGTLNFVIRF